jgi:hypothetical protein
MDKQFQTLPHQEEQVLLRQRGWHHREQQEHNLCDHRQLFKKNQYPFNPIDFKN